MTIAGSIGVVLGFYLGIFLLLSIMGFGETAGWQFRLATVPLGALFGALAVALASPDRRYLRSIGTATVVAVAVLAVLWMVDDDFAVALIGTAVATVPAVLVVSTA